MKQKGFAPIMVLLLIIGIGLIAASYLAGSKGIFNKFATPSSSPIVIPTSTETPAMSLPKKHFLPTDKFFSDNYPYPLELTNLKESGLVGFACSNKYSKQLDGLFVAYTNNSQGDEKETLTDQNILAFLHKIEDELPQSGSGNTLTSAVVCKTDQNKTIVSYEITPRGGGVGSSVYYGYLTSANSMPITSVVPIENGPYFACADILAITNSGNLYVNCGAGDGGFGSKSLYKVSLLTSGTATLLYKCTSTIAGDPETDKPVIKCGTTQ